MPTHSSRAFQPVEVVIGLAVEPQAPPSVLARPPPARTWWDSRGHVLDRGRVLVLPVTESNYSRVGRPTVVTGTCIRAEAAFRIEQFGPHVRCTTPLVPNVARGRS